MRYPSYSFTDRIFEVAALKTARDSGSWITAALDALYEARRRQAIRDIRRHRHLCRRPEHLALDERTAGKGRATAAHKRVAVPRKFSLPLIMMQGALIAVLALFFYLLLHVLA
jgi:hypothetical protein